MKLEKALSKIMTGDKVTAMSHSYDSRSREYMPHAEAVPRLFQKKTAKMSFSSYFWITLEPVLRLWPVRDTLETYSKRKR